MIAPSDLVVTLVRVSETALEFMCPRCRRPHQINATACGTFDAARGFWRWNQSLEAPTFWPSLVVENVHGICHSWIVDGIMEVLPDSTATPAE